MYLWPMVSYLRVSMNIHPSTEENLDIVAAFLSELPIESLSFNQGLEAYIQADQFDPVRLQEIIDGLPEAISATWACEPIKQQNWNEEWEKNYYQPIEISGKLYVRSSFHDPNPEMEHEIIIDPKMSFGTGHHQTTTLMCQQILNLDMKGKRVLDMGTGTGILGILCSKLGASSVLGVEIDDWVCDNARENIQVNGVTNMEVKHGDADLLAEYSSFDLILANIHREVIIRDLPLYVQVLSPQGTMLLSGFYMDDIPRIKTRLEELGQFQIDHQELDDWVVLKAEKLATNPS